MRNIEENIDSFDINEEDFDYVKQSFTEAEKRKIKNNIRKRVCEERKKDRKIKMAIAAASLTIVVGVSSVPAVAKNIPFISSIYEKMGFGQKYLDYSNYIGETIEHNGTKVTIDNIIGTKHKIVILAKVESEKEISQDDFGKIMIGSGSGGSVVRYTGENCEKMIYAEGSSFDGNKKKGDLKVRVSFPDGYIETVNYPIDFTRAFQEVKDIDIEKDIKPLGLRVKKIESDILGSRMYTTSIANKAERVQEPQSVINENNRIMIKVGEKFYPLNSWMGDGATREYDLPKGLYNEINSNTEVEIFPIITTVESEDIWNLEEEDINPMKEENIKYYKEIKLEDGTKAEVDKVEVANGTVKVYYKSTSEKNSLLVGAGMCLMNNDGENKGDWKYYTPAIYKEKGSNNIYVAEFTDVESNIELNLNIDTTYRFTNKTEIEDGIKCNLDK